MIRRGIPTLFYFLTVLTGVAAAICFQGLFRQYKLLFGIHTVSTITLMVSGFMCLAFGSYAGGKLADKTGKRLHLFAGFSVITAVFLMLHPVIFKWVTALYLNLNATYNPSPFGLGIIRLAFSIVVFAIPCSLFTASFCMLFRHYIRHISHSGRFMNATISAGSTGLLTGMLLSSLFLIPAFGQKIALFCSGLVYLFSAVPAIWLILNSQKASARMYVPAASERVKKTSLRFRKKKIVLETGARLTRAMMRTYAFQASAMASILLLSFRILENYSVLKPVYFYSIVWTVILIGLVLGGSFYKRFSEKYANKYLTMATLQIAAGLGALLSYLILDTITGTGYAGFLEAKTFAGLLLKQGLLFSVLLLIPSVFTGLSLPLAGKIYPRRMQKIGSNFGHLGYLFYVSAMFGTLVALFVLIPLAGQYYAFIILTFLSIISGIYLAFRDSRLIRGFRIGYAVTVLMLFLTISITLHALHTIDIQKSSLERNIEGSTSRISSIEHPDGSRSVYLNGKYYFGTNHNNLKPQRLPALLPVVLNQKIQTALVIGFGTGLAASGLEEAGISDIHIADIFPEAIRVSSDVFSDVNDDIMTNSKVEITIEDARSYLFRTDKPIDLITTGAVMINRMPDIYTHEFYRICFERSSLQGMLCQLLPLKDITGPEFRSILKSCANNFPNVTLWYISSESILLVASKNSSSFELCKLLPAFTAVNKNLSFVAIDIANIESLLAHLVMDDGSVRQFIGDVPGNSDNNPIVEFSREPVKPDTGVILSVILKSATVDFTQILDLHGACSTDSSDVIRRIKSFSQKLLQQADLSSGLQE